MKREGPSLEALMDRLASVPQDILDDYSSSPESKKGIYLPALVNDMLVEMGGSPVTAEEAGSLDRSRGENYTHLAGILSWLFHDSYFVSSGVEPGLVRSLIFSDRLATLARSAESHELFITDPDRREELCRLALDAVGLFPAGENGKRARERLQSLDSIERKKILDKTAEAQKRAREIREAMLRQEAEEAASKMSRE